MPAAIETTASVDVHGDRRQPSADDTDRLESDAMFARPRRGKQRAGLHCDAQPRLVLEHPLPDDAFQGQTRVADLDLWSHLETKFADQLRVLREAIVENHAGSRDGVLAAGPLARAYTLWVRGSTARL
jgi:hypothetical protein